MSTSLIILLGSLITSFLVGCSSVPTKEVRPENKLAKIDTTQDGILIISGEGLNASYADNIQASGATFAIGAKFAEKIQEELTRNGIPTQIFINRDKTANPQDYIGVLYANKKRDALVTAAYKHKKTADENYLYLEAKYLPFQTITSSDGKPVVILGSGPVEKYIISGENSKTPFDVFAGRFVHLLIREGLVKNGL